MSPGSQSATAPRRAWLFAAWTFGIGWGVAAILGLIAGPMGGPIDPPESESPTRAATTLSVLFFLLPFIVTIVAARRWSRPLKSWGLRMAPVSTLLTAPLVALALAVTATALPIAVGISEFDPSGAGEVQRLAEARSVEALELHLKLQEQPNPVGGEILTGLVAGIVLGVLFAPIIELPWRGLALTELFSLGFAKAALATALLSGLWWLPFQLLVGMAGFHSADAAAVSVVSYALLGIPLAWVRLRTGSILPASILAVTVSALSDLPRLATSGGSHLQLELCSLAAVGLLAGAALIWSPKQGADRSSTG